jgi:hypothetical protein
MERARHEFDDDSVLHPRLKSEHTHFPWVQVILILAALGGLYGLFTWLRQPASASALISQIERALQDGEWNVAQRHYDDLAKHHKTDLGEERLQQIAGEITGVKTYEQAKRQAGPFTFAAPHSEAERFYRRGVLAYFDGRTEEARKIWQELIGAFKTLPEQSAWVRLAEEALKQADLPAEGNLDQVLKPANNESPTDHAARLNQLKLLYQALPDGPLKKNALEKIEKASGKH